MPRRLCRDRGGLARHVHPAQFAQDQQHTGGKLERPVPEVTPNAEAIIVTPVIGLRWR